MNAQPVLADGGADGASETFFFRTSHGKPGVDDRRVLSGIIFINRNGLRWRDAPKQYGPAKTFSTLWKTWSDSGVFARMIYGLAPQVVLSSFPGQVQISMETAGKLSNW